MRYKGCDLQGLDLQGVKHLLKIRVDLRPDRLSKVATRVELDMGQSTVSISVDTSDFV